MKYARFPVEAGVFGKWKWVSNFQLNQIRKGEKKIQKIKKKIWICLAAVIVIAVIFAVVYFVAGPKTKEGSKTCTLEVMDDAGEVTSYELSTEVETLR